MPNPAWVYNLALALPEAYRDLILGLETLATAAKRLGVTKERVRQRRKDAFDLLRLAIGDDSLDDQEIARLIVAGRMRAEVGEPPPD